MTRSYEEALQAQRLATKKSMKILYRARRLNAVEEYGGQCLVCENTDRANLQVVPRKGYRWSQAAGLTKPIKGGHEKLRWLDLNDYPNSFTVVCGPTFSVCRKALQLLD